MKKLNKHPRLYKKMANALKKLITNKIKIARLKIINGQNKNGFKANGNNILSQQILKPGQQLPNKLLKGTNNNIINQNNNEFNRIINVASFRKIPYNEFILRLTPYDYETYLKMIKMNYTCRLEVHIQNIRSIKFIIGTLLEKWRNIQKAEPKTNLYLIPIRELWIPKELIFFSINDCEKIYDIGDIYTAYGSPSTNILHMKYQWNDEKINLLNINSNINQLNELTNNNNLTIQPVESINESEFRQENKLIRALSRLENSTILNRSHTSIFNNNPINFVSNRAIKANDSEDLFDLSDLEGGDTPSKKKMNNSESPNKDEHSPLFEDKFSKFSEQDSILPFDTELLDPMELLGIDNDKRLDYSISNKVRTPSISKRIHLRHKKISFVNNIKPTQSMINSSFANKSANNKSNSNGLKLRTGYSEVFSNSNNNLNNNLAYTSNNNLSEVSAHINQSNQFCDISKELGKNVLDKNSENKSKIIDLIENKDNKNIHSFGFSKLNNENNVNDSNVNDLTLKNNNINSNSNIDNTSQRKKKKIKFVNNVSKENIQELKEIQKSKNDSMPLIKLEEKKDNNNNQSQKNINLGSTISFGKKEEINFNKVSTKENNLINPILLTATKEKPQTINNEDTSNKKKIILKNNQTSNWQFGMGGGMTRFLGGGNSNFGFGINDTNNFFGQNTIHYNGLFDNGTILKSNLNTSNMFNLDNGYEDNQMSLLINRNEERAQHQPALNNPYIGNIQDNSNINNNCNNSIILNNGIDTNENINLNNNINKEQNVNKNTKEFLNKKRKDNTKKNRGNEKKSKKINDKKNIFSNNNENENIKTPSFQNNLVDNRNGNNIINSSNYSPNRKPMYHPFPYNIDIPLPSKFFEESINNQKK